MTSQEISARKIIGYVQDAVNYAVATCPEGRYEEFTIAKLFVDDLIAAKEKVKK